MKIGIRRKLTARRFLLCGLMAVTAVALLGVVALAVGQGAQLTAELAGSGSVLGMASLFALGQVVTDEEFRKTLLEGMEGVNKRFKTFDDFQTETKQALGELKATRDTVNKQADVIASLKKALAAFERERAMAIGGEAAMRNLVARENAANYIIGCFKAARKLELSPAQKTAITGVDSGVGAAITPQETGKVVYDNLLGYGQFATLGLVPIGSRTQVLPYVSARPTAYIVGQGAQITEGAVTGSSTTATIKEFAAWLPVPNAMLEDAEDNDMDLAMYLLDLIAQAIAYRLDWAAFAADGTDDTTDGAYTGIAVGGTAATAGAGNTTVAELELPDFVRCLTTVGAGVLQRNAKWWIHPTIIAKICLVRDANGRPIFQLANESPSGTIGSILGFPVVPTGAMPSTDSAGNVVAVFGDPRGCAVGIRKQLNLASSSDFQFDYNRTAFRGVMRAGVQVQLATSFAKLTLPAQ
jgi:HK97 family phage major capsid protein